MGNLGMPEMIFILVLALLLFGPKKLPEIGKQVGKALGEFKRATNDLKRTIEDEVEKATTVEEAKKAEEASTKTAEAVPGPLAPTGAANAMPSVAAPPEGTVAVTSTKPA